MRPIIVQVKCVGHGRGKYAIFPSDFAFVVDVGDNYKEDKFWQDKIKKEAMIQAKRKTQCEYVNIIRIRTMEGLDE